MKKLADRLDKLSLENRFKSFYSLEINQDYELLNFGIAQDNALVPELGIKKLLERAEDYQEWKYAEDEDRSVLSSFIEFAVKNYGYRVNKGNVALTMGIKEALNTLAFLIINPGDFIIATSPGYNVFQRKVKLLGGHVYDLQLNEEDDYLPKLDDIPEEILQKTKVFLVNYPNNPTGAIANSLWAEKLFWLAKKYDFLIINDAAYIDYFPEYERAFSFINMDPERERTIELYSSSKTFGMTGARLGVMVGVREIIECVKQYRDQENSGQFLPLLETYKYCLENVDMKENRDKYRHRARIMIECLKNLGFIDVSYRGAFYIFIKVPYSFDGMPIVDAFDFARVLKQDYGIIVIPYEKERMIRIALTYKSNDDPQTLYQRLSGHKLSFLV